MKYIETIDEFSVRIDERRQPRLSNRTGNEVATMLGQNERAGREIFKTINENVEKLEEIIDNYNVEHHTVLKKSPLEVKIDKSKLDLKYLISLTKLRKTPFISDVIIANILNYKILIRPIKNAKIISLAYRYYLAMVRHCLQTSLLLIELSSDMFFSQINANLVGRKKQMKEMMDNLISTVRKNTMDFIAGQSMWDENGKEITLKNIVDEKQLDKMMKLMKHVNTYNNTQNYYDRYSGYNQNVFQDSGRTIESMLKSNQDKELQALGEQINAISNTTSTKTRENTASAKEHVANYATMVKLSTERRAMEVCSQITMNMIDIMKMFSIRNIDGFSEAFEESSKLDKKLEELDKQIEQNELNMYNMRSSFENRVQEEVNKITKEVKDEDKEKQLKHWVNKGFEEICDPDVLKEKVYNNESLESVLDKAGFNKNQIHDILHTNTRITEYDKIYCGDLESYLKKDHDTISINGKNVTFEEVKNKPDDELYCWMKKNTVKYKDIKSFIENNDEQ